jgi:TusA-related sulfurtransferase
MPLVVLQRELRAMAVGDEIEIVTDDRAFDADLESWCVHHGQAVTARSSKDGVYRAIIAKRSL